ncbi:proteasome assembly chaperone 4 family protein [Mesoterricola silvestris]|uniref:Prenylated flavin chaperone LpdD-like domain-containing protein n=1 Tax=Mesoterricola silvestris TaxID=2927979 RepID=A0AA48GM36_9BACT|nr:proteasome assembly chaperone 4 family protein [Mesoterricola silvestris]BDU71995.1 hypothetical protein METEAL_11690 [Mesoterricola silvestris]
MEPITLTASRGRVALRMTCVPMGRDLSVSLSGGDREHIGAVALGLPRPKGDGATTSVLAVLGHREDDLARSIATRLASRLGVAVSVACGIHVDDIRREELPVVLEMSGELADKLASQLER